MAVAAVGVNYLPDDIESWAAGSDLSAARGKIVKLDSTMNQVVLCGNTDVPYGVVVENAAATATGTPVGVVSVGSGKRVKVLCAGSISIGATVGSDASGLGEAETADAAKTVGLALETGAASSFITVALGQLSQRAS